MTRAHPLDEHPRRGTTFTDMLVLTGTVALCVGALIPVLGPLNRLSSESSSLAKLNRLNEAHACYAADWNDRQVSWIPDDFAADGTDDAGTYTATRNCFSAMKLGWTTTENGNNALYALWLECHAASGSNNSFIDSYKPVGLTTTQPFGSFRMPNTQRLRSYVSRRFYAPQWYAEGDYGYEFASTYFNIEGEFILPSQFEVELSSYSLSPAAMYDPGVLRKASEGGYQSPEDYPDTYRSPPVGACSHPAIKTRMIEHNWFRGAPNGQNGSGFPWQFNHGLAAQPCTLFFDGSTSTLSTMQAWLDDLTVLGGTNGEDGLWSRDTGWQDDGHQGVYSLDMDTQVSHHILTTEGIKGRDILSRSRKGRNRR